MPVVYSDIYLKDVTPLIYRLLVHSLARRSPENDFNRKFFIKDPTNSFKTICRVFISSDFSVKNGRGIWSVTDLHDKFYHAT